MTDFHQQVINDLLRINANLLDAARREEYGRFIAELTAIERCANYAKVQLQRRIVLDDDIDDDSL